MTIVLAIRPQMLNSGTKFAINFSELNLTAFSFDLYGRL